MQIGKAKDLSAPLRSTFLNKLKFTHVIKNDIWRGVFQSHAESSTRTLTDRFYSRDYRTYWQVSEVDLTMPLGVLH
jgi:hypothetical protein